MRSTSELGPATGELLVVGDTCEGSAVSTLRTGDDAAKAPGELSAGLSGVLAARGSTTSGTSDPDGTEGTEEQADRKAASSSAKPQTAVFRANCRTVI
jgi:hypothetical protein